MKILALINVAPEAAMADVAALLRDELEASWSLFTQGVLREAYATADPRRVVFVLESETIGAAATHMRALPLMARKLLRLELVELRPFANWSLLFGASAAPAF